MKSRQALDESAAPTARAKGTLNVVFAFYRPFLRMSNCSIKEYQTFCAGMIWGHPPPSKCRRAILYIQKVEKTGRGEPFRTGGTQIIRQYRNSVALYKILTLRPLCIKRNFIFAYINRKK
jgi:hypothetical protein